jgi:hypothetical protein
MILKIILSYTEVEFFIVPGAGMPLIHINLSTN